MILALTRLVLRTAAPRLRRRAEGQRAMPIAFPMAPSQSATPCAVQNFEVLVAYSDPHEALVKRVSRDTRFTLVYEIWARDTSQACARAKERFHDHRFAHPSARIASEGPVALRVVRTNCA